MPAIHEADEGDEEAQAHRDGGLEGEGAARKQLRKPVRTSRKMRCPSIIDAGLAVTQAGAEDEREGDDAVGPRPAASAGRCRDNAHEDRR